MLGIRVAVRGHRAGVVEDVNAAVVARRVPFHGVALRVGGEENAVATSVITEVLGYATASCLSQRRLSSLSFDTNFGEALTFRILLRSGAAIGLHRH